MVKILDFVSGIFYGFNTTLLFLYYEIEYNISINVNVGEGKYAII